MTVSRLLEVELTGWFRKISLQRQCELINIHELSLFLEHCSNVHVTFDHKGSQMTDQTRLLHFK